MAVRADVKDLTAVEAAGDRTATSLLGLILARFAAAAAIVLLGIGPRPFVSAWAWKD